MVWSDPEIKRLSKEFVTVADEAYMLYPENPEHLRQAANRAEHRFFRKYGEQMPPTDWNKGTKQGIYMIGPNSEYLEGRFAASGEPEDIKARLRRALERWDSLRKKQNYANKAIPARPWAPPPDVVGELILRTNVRDLPRGAGDTSGSRRHEIPADRMWLDFTRWAWNESWIAFDNARALVPNGASLEHVDAGVARQIAREAMVDTVRGQAPEWSNDQVKRANLTMRRLPSGNIEYAGDFLLEAGPRKFEAQLYGRGVWDGKKFTSLDLVATGMRTGAAGFNQRERDPGPAPMGVTLSLRRQ